MSSPTKLKESIPSNTIKIIDLYNKIETELLDTSPNFQRKLVWKKQHKYAFINTILLNYPFPEIYIASAEIDVKSLQAKEIVVDGQQRLNAIVDYIKGINDFSNQSQIPSFNKLSVQEKKEFLNYPVSVKDLKDLPESAIKEVFRRINSTEYSLNSNEIINAQYGGGEFAIFCKQLADSRYKVSKNETDVIVNEEKRKILTDFFKENHIFTENDVRRMFDSQYLMLITSTILEGKYFGRNSQISHYLEKYNFEFSNYNQLLDLIISSIDVISNLKLSGNSYWFNKPNLFTLIIEISKTDVSKIDIEKLERTLIDLENKVDMYFSGDEEDIKLLSTDESKYFEVARQGSHELAAREHRGKVIQKIIQQSTINLEPEISSPESVEDKNLHALSNKSIDYSILIPTETGLKKSIMDATSTVRDFLQKNNIHNYSSQEFGPSNKVKIQGVFIEKNNLAKMTEASLYRSNGRGDFRIWFSDLKVFTEVNDKLGLLIINDVLNIFNLTKFDYTDFFQTLN
jgi:Protein of unknown function DUF262.